MPLPDGPQSTLMVPRGTVSDSPSSTAGPSGAWRSTMSWQRIASESSGAAARTTGSAAASASRVSAAIASNAGSAWATATALWTICWAAGVARSSTAARTSTSAPVR